MSWQFPLILAQQDAAPVTPGTPAAPAAGGATAPGTTTAAPGAAPGGAAPAKGPEGFGSFGTYMILILVVMWLMIFLPQRREKKKLKQLLESIKKGDRVTTIGGVIGTVIEVRDDEVVVKVDEANNTRIHFRRNAIQSVGADAVVKK